MARLDKDKIRWNYMQSELQRNENTDFEQALAIV